MNGALVVLASPTASDKVINATPVPMATEQLCNEAKNKLMESYRRSNTDSVTRSSSSACALNRLVLTKLARVLD